MTGEEIKKLIDKHRDYYNRYDKRKNWDYVAVLVGRATQAAEINEIQNVLEDKTKAIGYSLYEQGMIIDGCGISYSSPNATLAAGLIFLDGLVYEAADKVLTITGNAIIGVWKISTVLTHEEDNSLRNPALGYPEYKSPGAYRIITTTQWGLSNEAHDNATFCAVYKIEGGIITRLKKKKPDIAHYDRHAHGNYAVEGLNVSFVRSSSGKQTYEITKGLAHINGYETEIFQDITFTVDEVLDGENITKEVTQSEILSGSNKITLDHVPVEKISLVRVTKQKTVTNLTHGPAGCIDILPDESVTKIIEVKQGAKIYVQDTDFAFVSHPNALDWSLAGDEPTAGSKYDITYQYRVNADFTFDSSKLIISDSDVLNNENEPDDVTDSEFEFIINRPIDVSVSGSDFLNDDPIDVVYTYRIPRKDIIVMREDSSIALIRGVPDDNNPVVPDTPSGTIRLAVVSQTWINPPDVNNSVRSIQEQINELTRKLQELEVRLNDS